MPEYNTEPPLIPCVTPLKTMPTPSVAMKELILNVMRSSPFRTPTATPATSMAGTIVAAPRPKPPRKAPSIMMKPSAYPSERSNSPTISGRMAANAMQQTVTWTTSRFLRLRLVRNCGLRKGKTITSAMTIISVV